MSQIPNKFKTQTPASWHGRRMQRGARFEGVKHMKEQTLPLFDRLGYFALLAFFAMIPTYIVIGFFINIATSGDSFTLTGIDSEDLKDIAIVLSIILFCIFLSYILLLLAYRSLTWKSGRKDGSLLPPKVIKACYWIVGAIVIASISLAFYNGEYRKLFSTLLFILLNFLVSRKYSNALNN